jgi:hypothetical protein
MMMTATYPSQEIIAIFKLRLPGGSEERSCSANQYSVICFMASEWIRFCVVHVSKSKKRSSRAC